MTTTNRSLTTYGAVFCCIIAAVGGVLQFVQGQSMTIGIYGAVALSVLLISFRILLPTHYLDKELSPIHPMWLIVWVILTAILNVFALITLLILFGLIVEGGFTNTITSQENGCMKSTIKQLKRWI